MIATNWCAITGAPSSGKTSVIEELQKRGQKTEPEAARAVIEKMLSLGKTLADVRSTAEARKKLQIDILDLKMAREKALDPKDRVFMDRGMPDSISYFRVAGLDVAPAVDACKIFRYRHVFIFDRLPLEHDNVRTETDAEAAALDRALEEDYKMLGYDPVRVAVMPVAARADFILNLLRDEG